MILRDKKVEGVVVVEIGDEISTGREERVVGEVEIDIENCEEITKLLDSLVAVGDFKVVVDLENVVYVDSSGLWALFEGDKKMRGYGGSLKLAHPNPDIKRVLDITKLSRRMEVYPDREEAIESFRS